MSLKSKKLPIPGLLWGNYPEKGSLLNNGHLYRYFADRLAQKKKVSIQKIINASRLDIYATANIHSKEYLSALHNLRINLAKDGFSDDNVTKAFALIDKAFYSILNVRLFDTQKTAAYYILKNRLVEMATGEGKTYAIALASATAALSGIPVHIITANDYLATRDANLLREFYQSLGLSVDSAVHDQDIKRRKQAYTADITYSTAKELVFDYLRDAIQRKKNPALFDFDINPSNQNLLLRGLCMAIIDEADSILIDEACVPLVLSQAVHNQQEQSYYKQSLNIASQLIPHEDFELNAVTMHVKLNSLGQSKLEAAAYSLPAVWFNKLHRDETVRQALAALHLYHRDQHYIVADDQVNIIDETTGRIARGRSWSRGLHQLIELKENTKQTGTLSTISQITYQRFFPKYLRLSGISGTLLESRHELFKTYGLCVSEVPLRTPCKRKIYPTRLFRNASELNDALVERIRSVTDIGRPVLIGTSSVAESESLSKRLEESSINHVLLNAKNDEHEAESIAHAGNQSAVTITTNMAGRGTDIKINETVNQLGGLHIINCQVNISHRIDRQLIGRSARQGDNGSAETWISLDNTLLQQNLPNWLKKILKKYAQKTPQYLINLILYFVQRSLQKHYIWMRKRLLENDIAQDKNKL